MEVWNQGAGQAMFPRKVCRDPALLLSSCWWVLGILLILGLRRHNPNPCFHLHITVFPLCLYPNFPLSISIYFTKLGPTLIKCDFLNLIICKDLTSIRLHSPDQGGHDFCVALFSPVHMHVPCFVYPCAIFWALALSPLLPVTNIFIELLVWTHGLMYFA